MGAALSSQVVAPSSSPQGRIHGSYPSRRNILCQDLEANFQDAAAFSFDSISLFDADTATAAVSTIHDGVATNDMRMCIMVHAHLGCGVGAPERATAERARNSNLSHWTRDCGTVALGPTLVLVLVRVLSPRTQAS
jgi:hypothetical protein